MYISQVTFEMHLSNEEQLKAIMQKKMNSAREADGIVQCECLRQETGEQVAYSLLLHWEDKEYFRKWMKEEHNPANRGPKPQGDRPEMTKSGAQYEVMEYYRATNEIFHRTSVRQFEDREVEPEKIEMLLRAGMQSPAAGNQQTWEFYVVRNREVLEKLSKTSRFAGCAANAPMAIVITYKDGGRCPEYNDIDCAIATENIWLEADALGLGAVMLGIAPMQERMDAVKEVLNLGDNEHAFTILPIGYPVSVKPQEDRCNPQKVHYVD